MDHERERRPTSELTASGERLFAWSGGGIVLIGDYAAGRWTLARGWRRADALTDVRRWAFTTPRSFAGQVRRLVLEACADPRTADGESGSALAWAEGADFNSRS